MKSLAINSQYFEEIIDKCYNVIESFLENNVIHHENQTITYKGAGDIMYENQKLLIAISELLVVQKNIKIISRLKSL